MCLIKSSVYSDMATNTHTDDNTDMIEQQAELNTEQQAQPQDNYELDYKCYMCGNPACYNDCKGYVIGCHGVGTDKHYCKMDYCQGGCGVLWCGCIDVCRKRCGH